MLTISLEFAGCFKVGTSCRPIEVGLQPLDQPKAESRPNHNSPASTHQLRRCRQSARSPISPAGGSVVPADKMLGVSTGQLLVILGACSVMMKPSDMIKMARVAGRMTGRAVGRLMIYRRQMDDIFEQTAAKKINTELQDAMSKLQSIGYEVQNLSRITPGQFIKRQHNTEGMTEPGTYDSSATQSGEFRDDIRSIIRDEIESFCRKNPDQFTRRLDNPDGIQNSEKTAEATKFDVTNKFSVTSKVMESANTSSTNLHSQAMMYARLSVSPGIKTSSSMSVSYGEHFKESNGLLNVLPISAESAGLLPKHTGEPKGSDILLEAVLEAEVAENAKFFVSQPHDPSLPKE